MKNGNPEYARNRRAFLRGSLVTGAAIAGATVLGGRKLFAQTSLSGQTSLLQTSGRLTQGDAEILRFLAAAELIEMDLWTQYAELGGIGDNPPIEIDPHQHLNNYQVALSNLDSDGPQYITSNTLDEVSHATFSMPISSPKGPSRSTSTSSARCREAQPRDHPASNA